MVLKLLRWNVRGALSSSLCLYQVLEQVVCDIALLSEHMLRNQTHPNCTSFTQTDKTISATSRCGKGGVTVMVKKSLEFQTSLVSNTLSDRIIGVELKCSNGEILYIFSVYLPADSDITSYKHEISLLSSMYDHYSQFGKLFLQVILMLVVENVMKVK